jgi:hypothetical protein
MGAALSKRGTRQPTVSVKAHSVAGSDTHSNSPDFRMTLESAASAATARPMYWC